MKNLEQNFRLRSYLGEDSWKYPNYLQEYAKITSVKSNSVPNFPFRLVKKEKSVRITKKVYYKSAPYFSLNSPVLSWASPVLGQQKANAKPFIIFNL